MQGLPSQIFPKLSKTDVLGEKKSTAKTGAANTQENGESKGSENVSGEVFASLLAGINGSENAKTSGVKSETGETLKALLAEKSKDIKENVIPEKKSEAMEVSGTKIIDPKISQLLGKNNSENIPNKIEQKIAKTSNNLEQLLNNLKKTQDLNESEDSISGDREIRQELPVQKNEQQIKGELKSESPLEFLMNAAKNKNVSEVSGESKGVFAGKETLSNQKNIVTAEDYIKNIESKERKFFQKPVTMNDLAEIQKGSTQNVKNYGQGLSLLSDPLIKNTNALAFKETKLGSKGNSSLDLNELRTPETKTGAELSLIKQDVIPVIQDNKDNHGQKLDNQVQINQKVLDLSQINTSNTNEIIKRISDYVEQSQVANKSTLDLAVKHDSLGEFKIQVSKMPSSMSQSQNLVDMQITTSSKEGHDFFMKNEVNLMKNLNQAGINLSDLRIVSSMSETTLFGQSDSKQFHSFGQNSNGTDKHFMNFESNSFSGDTSSGAERRKELWEEYRQRRGA